MIKINLLPGAEGKRSGKAAGPAPGSGFKILMSVITLLVMGGLFYGYMTFQKQTLKEEEERTAQRKLAATKKKIKDLQAKYDELQILSTELEEKFAVVQALANPQRRLYWSEKLNMLASVRLDLAVYITKLKLDETIEEIETPSSVSKREAWKANTSASKGAEPKAVKTPVVKQTLTLEAIAYGTDSAQRLRQLRSFINAIQQFTWTRKTGKVVKFIDQMDPNIDVLDQKVDIVGGVEISRFGLVIRALPQMFDSNADAQQPGGAPVAAAPAGK